MKSEYFYVIAGNDKEFQEYASIHYPRLSSTSMVTRLVLKSWDIPWDANPVGVFIGTWYKNPHAKEILDKLYAICTDPGKRFMIERAIQYYRRKQ